VSAFADIDFDLVVIGVGVFLALESFLYPVALSVNVIDDPRFLRFALCGFPLPFPD
jgi:hypothetical protein